MTNYDLDAWEDAWVKTMHDIGEHWECRAGEFGC